MLAGKHEKTGWFGGHQVVARTSHDAAVTLGEGKGGPLSGLDGEILMVSER